MIEDTKCPICNAKMKPATSKYGKYWRCSRFGCKGIRDSMGRSNKERAEQRNKGRDLRREDDSYD